MNVTPGVHKSLIRVCLMADEGYVTVFDENNVSYMTEKSKKYHIRKNSIERI